MRKTQFSAQREQFFLRSLIDDVSAMHKISLPYSIIQTQYTHSLLADYHYHYICTWITMNVEQHEYFELIIITWIFQCVFQVQTDYSCYKIKMIWIINDKYSHGYSIRINITYFCVYGEDIRVYSVVFLLLYAWVHWVR